MGTDMIDDMASAVENAQVVLMLESKEYSQSPYCKMEALYAFKTKIQIIPIRVQRHYNPTGWLGTTTLLI